MSDRVKTDRRAQRRAETEQRLLDAATHFATKGELLRRCIGVAIVDDAEPIALAERPAMVEAMSAPTLDERIDRMASLTASLMARTGALLEIALQAAPSEPLIAAAAAAGRSDTRRTLRAFWQRIHDDGFLSPSVDLDWLSETATLLATPRRTS